MMLESKSLGMRNRLDRTAVQEYTSCMTKLNKFDSAALLSLLIMGITFPVSGKYVLQFLDWIFAQIFMYGSWAFLVGAVYLTGYILVKVFKNQPINIPKKTARTQRAGKMIET